jgi:primary-amine oxidase
LLAGTLLLASLPHAASAAAKHPLDPLTEDELIVVRDVLAKSGRFSAETNFTGIQLDEPPKSVVQKFKEGSKFPRNAYVGVVDYTNGKTYRVIVDINAGRIGSIADLGTLQPGLNGRDMAIARKIVDADPSIRAALTKRGLSIPGRVSDAVYIHFGAVGYDPSLEGENNRLMRVWFATNQNSANVYSAILGGLMAVVDLYKQQVVRLHDKAGPSGQASTYDLFNMGVRDGLSDTEPKPTANPARSRVSVDGNVIAWRDWQFRYGFNLREGLVLHEISFNDRGRKRPILYRASVSSLVTLYGDREEIWAPMEYSEEANFGLGSLSVGVQAGREIPPSALALSPLLPDPTQPRFSEPAQDRIYVYERDAGTLMYYVQDGRTVHARGSELVVGFLVSIGNYAYSLNWVFKQDGAFAFEVELAGQILTKTATTKDCAICKALASGPGPNGAPRTYEPTGEETSGTTVSPSTVGISHQHWFNLRLDFDIDGATNAVMETNVKRLAPAERYFTATHAVFGKAADAMRHCSEETARTWTVYNPSSLNGSGRAAGYTIAPGMNASTIVPASRMKGIMGFTFHHFWTTPYRDGQLYADGAYPNQAKSTYTDTLHHYANDDPIYNRDLVVWYSMGDTHVPTPEDFPLMSNKKMSVDFRPNGFFELSPLFANRGHDK